MTSTFKVVLRTMRESDLEAVSELAMLANPFAIREKYYRHLLEELREMPDLSFVATIDEKVVGYVQSDIRDDETILEDIAVDREYQRRGIGTSLLEQEMKALKDKGSKTVLAKVHYKCASAIPFYYKHGFRIVGFRQDCFGEGQDAIILRKVL